MAAQALSERFEPTDYQSRVLLVPQTANLCLCGGRGGGKSTAVLLLAIRHIEECAAAARVLVVHRSFPGLEDFASQARLLLARLYPSVSYNAQHHVFRFGSGGTIWLGELSGEESVSRYQGQSYSLIAIDEAGQFPTARLADLLRGSLRSSTGVPTRLILSANPGGPGHGWLSQRHVLRAEAWKVYRDDQGERWLNAPAIYRDNPYLDCASYERQLTAATAGDTELRKAWLEGSWSIARGAFFSGVLDEKRNAVGWPREKIASPRFTRMGYRSRRDLWSPRAWRFYLSGDYGSSAPAVYYLCARSPGGEGPDGRYYPVDSVVLVDELALADEYDLTMGLGLTIDAQAAKIKEMCQRWSIAPRGVLDDAAFAAHGHDEGSIAASFRKAGVYFSRARKLDRVSGWALMRLMLRAAGEPDRPGLFIDRRCGYFWSTAPSIPRSPIRPEDLDSKAADHGCDATRYALLGGAQTVIVDLA